MSKQKALKYIPTGINYGAWTDKRLEKPYSLLRIYFMETWRYLTWSRVSLSDEITKQLVSRELTRADAWIKFRYDFLTQNAGRCRACNRSAADGIIINIDHVLPRKFYPHLTFVFSNLQILCNECNHGKGSRDRTDWNKLNNSKGRKLVVTCSKCKAHMVKRRGKYGLFWGCSKYPGCQNTLQIPKAVKRKN